MCVCVCKCVYGKGKKLLLVDGVMKRFGFKRRGRASIWWYGSLKIRIADTQTRLHPSTLHTSHKRYQNRNAKRTQILLTLNLHTHPNDAGMSISTCTRTACLPAKQLASFCLAHAACGAWSSVSLQVHHVPYALCVCDRTRGAWQGSVCV